MLCSLYSSLLSVTLLSVQRYLQVVNLQKMFDHVGKMRLLVLHWLVTMILCFPALVIRQVIKDQHGTDCTGTYAPPSQQVAVLLPECLIGFVSISVVAFSYIGVQRKVNQAAFFNNPQTTRLITMVLSICFLLGVPGNIAVIILKPNWQHLSSLSHSLMLNLAISDLICLLALPLWIYTLLYSWTFGLVACKILTYIMYCGVYSSMLTVTVLSVQRYLQVVNLQKIFKCVGKRRLLVLLWLVTMILSIPASVVPHVTKDEYGTSCTRTDSLPSQLVAMLLTECLVGLVAISVVAFSYIGLHSKLNHAAFFNNPQTTRLIIRVPGNIAVIILKPNWQHLSSLSQSLMLNLAISDLICLLLRPPSQLVAVLLKECLIGFFSISVVAFSYMGPHRKVNQAAFFNNPQTTRLVTSFFQLAVFTEKAELYWFLSNRNSCVK
ncbi:hypothetical protein NQZ68_034913 [Dissostichus eleginoides]|nr:hypothetical protein NQZ68_034913 [Dissostichus eleginoides]